MADHFLTEAGIGAGATRLGAVEACLYALDERIGVHDSYGARIGVEHFPGVSHWSFPFPRTCLQCNKARKRSAYSPKCVEGEFSEVRGSKRPIDHSGKLPTPAFRHHFGVETLRVGTFRCTFV